MRAAGRFSVASSLSMLACVVSAVQSTVPAAVPCLHYEPEVVELRGNLITVLKYGPPNFGETPQQDAKLQVPILVLSHPIDVCGESTSDSVNASSFRDVREIQVVFHGGLDAQPFVGHEVVVTGTLFERFTMNHYTPVLLSLNTIRAAHGD